MKFGGSSLATARRMQTVLSSIKGKRPVLVVLSAIGHTTDALEALAYLYGCGEAEKGNEQLMTLHQFYYVWCKDVFGELSAELAELVDQFFARMAAELEDLNHTKASPALLALGEELSVGLMRCYLRIAEVPCEYLSALDVLKLKADEQPDEFLLEQQLNEWLRRSSLSEVIITEGFICRSENGEVSNLKRGGSDYTASLFGAALGVDEIAIWSDIDGFHNNDPRFVEGTRPLRQMSFDEAAELAYFGASIMHPSSVLPAREKGIPVRLKNTLRPQDEGTLITDCAIAAPIRAIAAKSGITRLRVHSARMLQAYGFLRHLFAVFEAHKTPIDAITTSEVSVSLTIDRDAHLDNLLADLQALGKVEYYSHQALVCIVGSMGADQSGVLSQILLCFDDIPIHMVSHGGSSNNVTLVLDESNKQRALQRLQTHLFRTPKNHNYVSVHE